MAEQIETEIETEIDRHIIGGHGPLLSFVAASSKYGDGSFTKDDEISFLKRALEIEDPKARGFASQLIRKISSLQEQSDELRKRFDTTFKSLRRINDTLKMPGKDQ